MDKNGMLLHMRYYINRPYILMIQHVSAFLSVYTSGLREPGAERFVVYPQGRVLVAWWR